ncbi:BPI fold-containing family B member 6-like [Eublepharis macularius]|uniref:BPI fold-containing family B member 6-like n=1 Tax=Eublepharis macularius TaxID=481883 RepID=A0AA97JDB4_EUBMA|nr:BPI fold-containing family B member 6-like [Eublepharis macularius]
MGLDLKRLQMCLLLFFCGWVALSQGEKAPGPCVRIGACTILEIAKRSMTDSRILEQLAEAATKNQGGNKAIKGIKGLKVNDIRPPNVTVSFVMKVGMRMEVICQLTIAGKSFIGGSMEITVKSNMTTISKMIIKDKVISFEVTKCTVDLISCKTNLPSNMLPKIVNKFLNSTLGKVLPGMMCPAADKVVGQMKEKMLTVWNQQPIGDLGFILYALTGSPVISSKHAGICFTIQITRKNGEVIEIPIEPPALNVLPELSPENSELTMPVNILNALMKLLEDVLEREVSSDRGGPEINRDVLAEKVPSVEIPEGDLIFEIRSTETPTWALEPGVATLKDPLKIELKTRPEKENLFIVTATLKINATFQEMNGHLQILLGEDSLKDLALESSSVGDFDPELLNGYFLDILRATLLENLKKSKSLLDNLGLPPQPGHFPCHESISQQ